jgi:hypothetical protein
MNNPILEQLGPHVQRWCAAHSQNELERQLDWPRGKLSRWLNGLSGMADEDVEKLAKFLKLTIRITPF